jgi:cephalosporin hydroxylase
MSAHDPIHGHRPRRRRALAAILALGALTVLGSLTAAAPPARPGQGIIDRFISFYYGTNVWQKTTWLGVKSLQTPTDNWVMQEIIAELKPDFIVETGTNNGGTTLFYASILEMVNPKGKVITVDIMPEVAAVREFRVFRENVEVITGDSISPAVIDRIAERVRGHTALVTLDSLHTAAHVLRELELYSEFVPVGGYLVVQDTIANGHPVLPDFGPGPMEAVEQFLAGRSDFEIDRSREKFLLTFYRSGYLKRVADAR